MGSSPSQRRQPGIGHRRHRLKRDVYRAATYPPDTGQAEGFFGWMPTVFVAPIIGAVAALIGWNLWLFPVVTVAGVVLGIAAAFLLWYLFYEADARWLQLGEVSTTIAFLIFVGTGPVVTVLIAVLLLH